MIDEDAYRFLRADDWPVWREIETDQRRRIPPPPMQKPCPAEAVLVDLVAPDAITVGGMPLIDVIRRRRSRRAFDDVPLSLEEMSFLLWATQGVRQPPFAGHALRTVPSAGCRHAFETYLCVLNVRGLAPGIYRYLPMEHRLLLEFSEERLDEKIRRAALGNISANSGCVLLSPTIFPQARTSQAIFAAAAVFPQCGPIFRAGCFYPV